MSVKLKTGDVMFLKGTGFYATIVRFLIAVRYGISYDAAYSHVQTYVGDDTVLSAEPKGTVLVPLEKSVKNSDVLVYRFCGDVRQKEYREKYLEIYKDRIGKKYAFARYAMDALAVMAFTVLLFAVIAMPINILWSAYSAGCVFVLVVARKLLRKTDAVTEDCVEGVATILEQCGMYRPLCGKRNEHPNGMLGVFDNLCVYGIARLVLTKKSKGDWQNAS